jgi:transcriptional regulator with XRE-family HTH domain
LAQTTIDVGALYAALKRKRDAGGQSWRDVAAHLEISPSTFTRMAQGARPDIDTFATLLRWLNMPATAYYTRGDEEPAAPEDEPEPLVAIASLLRSSRSVNADQADALENIIEAAYKSIVKNER